MGRRRQFNDLVELVGALERQLDSVGNQLEVLVNLLAREGEEREQIPDAYTHARSDLKAPALGVERMRDAYSPSAQRFHPEVVLRGSMCSGLIGMQVVALDLAINAVSVAPVVVGPDVEYVQNLLSTSWSVYETHQSMIASALRAPAAQLVTISNLYTSDPSGAFAAFISMKEAFPANKHRILSAIAD